MVSVEDVVACSDRLLLEFSLRLICEREQQFQRPTPVARMFAANSFLARFVILLIKLKLPNIRVKYQTIMNLHPLSDFAPALTTDNRHMYKRWVMSVLGLYHIKKAYTYTSLHAPSLR